MPEMLTLTGESATFTLMDDIAMTKSSPGQPPEAGSTDGSAAVTETSAASTDATEADIVVGAVLKITYTTGIDTIAAIEILSGSGAPGAAPGGGGGSTVSTGAGAYLLADGETLSGGTYSSTNDDENALRAEGAITANLNGVSVEKTAGTASSSDASSFLRPQCCHSGPRQCNPEYYRRQCDRNGRRSKWGFLPITGPPLILEIPLSMLPVEMPAASKWLVEVIFMPAT